MKKIKISSYPHEIFRSTKKFKFTSDAEINEDEITDYEAEPADTLIDRDLYEEQLIEIPIDEIKISSLESDTVYKDENGQDVDTSQIVTDTGETLVYDKDNDDWIIKTSDSESTTTTKAIHEESETFEEDRYEDTPEEKTARLASAAGHPSLKAMRKAARQEVHEGKNEDLKNKWRRDVYEGTSSQKTADMFNCQDSEKDCSGECNGNATLDSNGKCCSEDERDCSGNCFGPNVVANRYVMAGNPPRSWLLQKCCDPNTDYNCCPPGELNCKGVCPNGVHPAPKFERLSQYIEGVFGCCHPEELGCCPPSEYNPCAKPTKYAHAPGNHGSCSKDATAEEMQKVFLGFSKKPGGGREKRCCDPKYSSRCCTDEMKKCGYCPSDPEYDKVHPDNDCCNELETFECCPKSESHCGKCKKNYIEQEWKLIKQKYRIINGECYNCHTTNCNELCEDSEKKCGQCPGSPEYNNWHLIDPDKGSSAGNCCHADSENCCAASARDCQGHCDGNYIIGPKGKCCYPDNWECCPNYDACGFCSSHSNYSSTNIINHQGICCDKAGGWEECCEKKDCCGLCNRYSYNSSNICVDSNGNACLKHR